MVLKKKEETFMSEDQYRAIRDRLSYSQIKLFDNDRRAFYRECVLGEAKKESESISIILGSLVHCYLADQDFYDKFHMLSAVEPKGQMKDLVDALFNRAMKSTSTDNEGNTIITEKFEVLFADAVQTVKYDHDLKEIAFKGKDLSKILALFSDSDAEIYYKEKLDAAGKMVVSSQTIFNAEKIVEKLRGHTYTHEYANARTGGEIEVFNELAILFDLLGVPYKSLIDKVIINHDEKTIQPIDWKTSWNNEEPEYAYLKFGYYLQAAMYDYALKHWAVEKGYTDYTVLPMRFIFCDTAGFSDPVVLILKTDDIERAQRGFRIRGYKYRGLTALMSDIQWHQETGNWATSKQVFLDKGKVNLALAYGSR